MDVVAVEGELDITDLRIGIAVSEFNRRVTEGLLEGALEAVRRVGASAVSVVWVPGAFELPLAAQAFAEDDYDVVIGLGAVVEGETDHYEHVAHRASEGLLRVSLDHGIPVAFGVLTTREGEHALARSAPGPDNKGAEAAEAALKMASARLRMRSVARSMAARDRQQSRRR